MNKRVYMNHRGDVTILVLIIGIFLVCVIAVVSFWNADNKFKNNFYGINMMEQVNADVEQFYTYINLGYSPQISAQLINAEYIEENGKVVVIIRREIEGKIKIERKLYYEE